MKKIYFRTLDLNGFWNREEILDFNIKSIIPRFKIRKILSRLKEKNIEIITGPRQTGKTTLLYLIMTELLREKRNHKRLFYVNLDTIVNYELFENPYLFYENIKRSFAGDKGINYLFIDEVQRLRNPGQFLKGIYDLKKNIKIIVTGSSSLEIKSKMKEFLTGRKRETILLPVSFSEYIDSGRKIPQDLKSLKINNRTLSLWADNELLYGKYLSDKLEYMQLYGGYPAVLTKKNYEQRIEELSEIFNSYIKKDVVEFLKIERIDIYDKLIKAAATQIGNMMNFSELCSLVQGNLITVTKYLSILEKTFITYYLRPFTSKRRNEVKHATKCYFIDTGLRNFAIRQFNKTDARMDSGALLENILLSENLKKQELDEEIFYWRTKAGAEIDCVIKKQGRIIPMEIKSGKIKIGALTKSFRSFINSFSPEKAVFINKDKFGIIKIHKTRVYYIPAKWFLLYGFNLIGE